MKEFKQGDDTTMITTNLSADTVTIYKKANKPVSLTEEEKIEYRQANQCRRNQRLC